MTSLHTTSIRDELIGAWELSACSASLPHDKSNVVYPLGRDAKGLILYTNDGYMSAQLSTPSEQPTSDYLETWGRYIAYTGPFYLDERGDNEGRPILQHKMQTSNVPFLVGMTQRRIFEILEKPTGRFLELSVEEPANVNGEYRLIAVSWRKVSAHTAVSPEKPEVDS